MSLRYQPNLTLWVVGSDMARVSCPGMMVGYEMAWDEEVRVEAAPNEEKVAVEIAC